MLRVFDLDNQVFGNRKHGSWVLQMQTVKSSSGQRVAGTELLAETPSPARGVRGPPSSARRALSLVETRSGLP